ncbi:MAG: hypothetical protein PUH10_07265 [Erysipelotrichaceae bacterium]|uniref:hypothetical protein n=1 Tax=Floccifex sp. TaxID=2815810 RepID=UPI002A74EA26|nr:hypothetical protein [Floccifex sp.]MDD7281765.1 hypothetical protein [Erysipelotrichaceae bacterium]MDY2958993.1 hypothetical protein [Floccifex sp.]
MLQNLIILGIVLLVGIVLVLIPTKNWNRILKPFTLSTTGIRYIRRRRDHVDTLANVFLFVSALFCILYWIIPFYQIFYVLWLLFSFLCTFAQASRVSASASTAVGKITLFGVYLMFGIGLVGGIGLLNNNVASAYVSSFFKDIIQGNLLNPYYYFTDPTITVVVTEGIILFFPCYCLWAQFNYMRLEDTFKARWIATYVLKVIFVCALMYGISSFGFDFIKVVFQIKDI